VSLFLVFGGAALRIGISYKKALLPAWIKWWQRVGVAAMNFGIFSLIFLFFRQEQTPWFSSRYWIVLLLLAVIAWGAYLGVLAWKEIPLRAAAEEEDRRKRKYLP